MLSATAALTDCGGSWPRTAASDAFAYGTENSRMELDAPGVARSHGASCAPPPVTSATSCGGELSM